MNLFHFQMFFQLYIHNQISTSMNLNFPPHSERIFLRHGTWFLLNALLHIFWNVYKNLLILSLFLYSFQIQSQCYRRFSMVCAIFKYLMLFLVSVKLRSSLSIHRAQNSHHQPHFSHHRGHFLYIPQLIRVRVIHCNCLVSNRLTYPLFNQ